MKRTLNSMDLTLLGLGSMVGAGIFTFTGVGVALIAGPSLIISIIIAGIAVGLSALIFAEFASRVPSRGGPYGYIYAVFGEFPAWIVGWLLAIEFLQQLQSLQSHGVVISKACCICNFLPDLKAHLAILQVFLLI